MDKTATAFAESIYNDELVPEDNIRINNIYETIESWLSAFEIDRINDFFKSVDVDKLDSNSIVTIFTACRRVQGYFESYPDFYVRARARVLKLFGDSRTNLLLDGFVPAPIDRVGGWYLSIDGQTIYPIKCISATLGEFHGSHNKLLIDTHEETPWDQLSKSENDELILVRKTGAGDTRKDYKFIYLSEPKVFKTISSTFFGLEYESAREE